MQHTRPLKNALAVACLALAAGSGCMTPVQGSAATYAIHDARGQLVAEASVKPLDVVYRMNTRLRFSASVENHSDGPLRMEASLRAVERDDIVFGPGRFVLRNGDPSLPLEVQPGEVFYYYLGFALPEGFDDQELFHGELELELRAIAAGDELLASTQLISLSSSAVGGGGGATYLGTTPSASASRSPSAPKTTVHSAPRMR